MYKQPNKYKTILLRLICSTNFYAKKMVGGLYNNSNIEGIGEKEVCLYILTYAAPPVVSSFFSGSIIYKLINKSTFHCFTFNLPSCKSEVHKVRLSLSNCMIKVESL
jgi:hypothetical protein